MGRPACVARLSVIPGSGGPGEGPEQAGWPTFTAPVDPSTITAARGTGFPVLSLEEKAVMAEQNAWNQGGEQPQAPTAKIRSRSSTNTSRS